MQKLYLVLLSLLLPLKYICMLNMRKPQSLGTHLFKINDKWFKARLINFVLVPLLLTLNKYYLPTGYARNLNCFLNIFYKIKLKSYNLAVKQQSCFLGIDFSYLGKWSFTFLILTLINYKTTTALLETAKVINNYENLNSFFVNFRETVLI